MHRPNGRATKETENTVRAVKSDETLSIGLHLCSSVSTESLATRSGSPRCGHNGHCATDSIKLHTKIIRTLEMIFL
jgi:hypothetical protein